MNSKRPLNESFSPTENRIYLLPSPMIQARHEFVNPLECQDYASDLLNLISVAQ